MSYVTINGVEHYYEWICESTSETRPCLVFLHGWGGSARYWERTAAALKHEYNCLLYDLRGFGRSSAAKDTTVELGMLESFAHDLSELLNILGLEQVYINAHSMGASVALYFLERFPNRVHRAILTCNGAFEYDKHAFEAFQRFGSYVVMFRPKWLEYVPLAPQIFMSRFLKQPISQADKKVFLRDFLEADTATAIATLKASVSQHATETMPEAFATINVPTLLVSGKYDRITPAALGRHAASLNKKIDYFEFPETGHFPMLEDAETYRSVITDFLHQ